jgi:hypothetical protein
MYPIYDFSLFLVVSLAAITPSFSIDVLSTSTLVLVPYVSLFLLALRRACALFLARRLWSAILQT